MKHITYIDNYYNEKMEFISEVRKSKVYGTYTKSFPSGQTTIIKVWNTRINQMVSIRKDTQLVKVID